MTDANKYLFQKIDPQQLGVTDRHRLANNPGMGIPQREPMTQERRKAHKDLIALCRGVACMVELERVFGTAESNALERIIDGKEACTNEDGEAQWSRKYDRYLKGKAPGDITLLRAERAAIEIGRPIRLRYWRDHPLWILLAEPVASLTEVRAIMASLPRIVRKEVYHLGLMDPQGRQVRQEFTRSSVIRLRDLGTLDAFVGLIALAREGEILEEDPRQALPARCAFEIFPRILLDHPQLHARWPQLYAALELAFWRRVYHGGVIFNDYTLQNAEVGLATMVEDRSAKLPWTAGTLSTSEA